MALPTGGVITTDGNYRVHTFKLANSGTAFTPGKSGNVKVLVIGGGGGGGGGTGGGGGGGGYQYNAAFAVTAQAYTVTVGDGGNGGVFSTSKGSPGQDSVFSTITAAGGGGGGTNGTGGFNDGANGGCGGGDAPLGTGAGGTGSQGFAGGSGLNTAPNYGAGGGGGTAAVGANGSSTTGGNGGAGTVNTIYDGSNIYYGGGGGGGTYGGGTLGNGVNGGGNGGGFAGSSDTGGGGGGQKDNNASTAGGKGGSGIVIIRYLTSDFYVAENYTKTFDETITLSEVYGRAVTKTFGEIISLSEALVKATTRVFTEISLTISETVLQQKGKSLSDIITITDLGIGRAFTRVYSEISNITDSISKAIARSLVEVVNLAPNPIIDSYSESNFDTIFGIQTAGRIAGQTFRSIPGTLNNVKFYLSKGGLPVGNIRAELYATNGTFGVDENKTGSALAVSDNVDVSTLTASMALITFNFTGVNKYSLSNGVAYAIMLVADFTVNGVNFYNISLDTSSPSHNGAHILDTTRFTTRDMCFYVYSDGGEDTLSKIKGYVRTLSDEFSVEDLGITRAFTRVFSELVTLTEAFIKATTRIFTEIAITITDAYLSTRAKIFNEIITLTEIFRKIYGRFITFTETEIAMSDAFTKLKGKNFFDIISITDLIQKLWDRIASGIPTIFSARDSEKATGRTSALDKPQGLTNMTIEATGDTKAVNEPMGIVRDTDKPVKV